MIDKTKSSKLISELLLSDNLLPDLIIQSSAYLLFNDPVIQLEKDWLILDSIILYHLSAISK
ncbi:MAG: hypothetical protein CVV00_13300 [Firmicutes bacterium HGW-Firmicutes-5]|nr:MAG: hypothetical protein CVV00_13300 [Firmicutes bacterium HGW-Firmicutes-5]